MTSLDVTRTGDWHTMFLPGIPPKELTPEQWHSLQELASIYTRRQQERGDSHNPNVSMPGGWHLSARTSEFDKLHNVAAAIIANDYKSLQNYRNEEQA